MKAIVMFVIGIVFFISVGGQAAGSQPGFEAADQRYELARNSVEITGSWYSFPAGTVIRFNQDGTVDFGVDAAGEAVGYKAGAWFEGERLFIRFTDYAGADDCQSAVGTYTVQQFEHGSIRFVPQQDACEWRVNILNGHPDLGFQLSFQAVD